MYYGARWYDISLGRFAQADSIVSKCIQGLDRYSYTFNNPINFIDPSGHVPVDCIGSNYCGLARDPKYVLDSQFKPKFTPKPKPPKNENDSYTIISNILENAPSGQEICQFVFSGAPLLCGGNSIGTSINNSQPNLIPDYGTIQIGFPIPVITQSTFAIVNGAATITYSNDNLYIALGLNAGKTFVDMLLFGIPGSGNVSAGWIIPNNEPTPQETHDFLTGWAVNVSVGVGGGGGVTLTSGGMAVEGGLYSPQAGISATYTVLNINLANGTWDILP